MNDVRTSLVENDDMAQINGFIHFAKTLEERVV
jgi:hypothetical protein